MRRLFCHISISAPRPGIFVVTKKLEKLNEQSLVWRDQSSTYQTLLRESGQTLTNQRPAKILGTVFKSVNQSRKDF